jgi:hypothetical protein
MFSPYALDWTVRGTIVGGRVPIFEDMSVPYDFSSPELTRFHGAKVRVHFDPTARLCFGTAVLRESWLDRSTGKLLPSGTILPPLRQINETTGYVRLALGWGDDPATLGLKAKQASAAAVRKELRTIMPRGQKGLQESIEHDGLALTTKLAIDPAPAPPPIDPARLAAADAWEAENILDRT